MHQPGDVSENKHPPVSTQNPTAQRKSRNLPGHRTRGSHALHSFTWFKDPAKNQVFWVCGWVGVRVGRCVDGWVNVWVGGCWWVSGWLEWVAGKPTAPHAANPFSMTTTQGNPWQPIAFIYDLYKDIKQYI